MGAGAVLIFAVLGASIFGGFDPRKKKGKKPSPTPTPTPAPTPSGCTHEMVYPGGNAEPTVRGFTYDTFVTGALNEGKGVVTIAMREPNEGLLLLLSQVCHDYPALVFVVLYSWNVNDPATQLHLNNLLKQDGGYDAIANVLVPTMLDGKLGVLESNWEVDASMWLEARRDPHDYMTNLIQLGVGAKTNKFQEFYEWG